jgi:hypothetical protein
VIFRVLPIENHFTISYTAEVSVFQTVLFGGKIYTFFGCSNETQTRVRKER